jgi:hypothetical protein
MRVQDVSVLVSDTLKPIHDKTCDESRMRVQDVSVVVSDTLKPIHVLS